MKHPPKHLDTIVVLAFAFILFALVGPYPCEAVGWKKQTISSGPCQHHAIAIDNSGNPHIIYMYLVGDDNYLLRRAFFDGQAWQTDVIDSGNVGYFPSIKVDSLGHIHTAYLAFLAGWNSPRSLIYAFFDGSSWAKTIVESGGSPSIALDGNNRPHISYITEAKELKYARYDGSNWIAETIAENAGSSSLALTQTGAAYIAFSKIPPSCCNFPLHLATNISGSWEESQVAVDGPESSLALDSLGNPHIFFLTGGRINYTRFNGTDWITEYEDVPAQLYSPRIALDRLDFAHMSFGGGGGGISLLIYGYHNGEDWLFSRSLSLVHKKYGGMSSMAVDNQGLPHISSMISNHKRNYASLGYFHFPGMRLKVSRAGKGSGTVTSAPEGISCGSVCAANYMPTASITLTAEPDLSSTFAGWTRCPFPSGNQCTIIIPEKKSTVKARFNKIAP